MREHLTGLIAAAPTPMYQNGTLNLNMVERQAQCLVDNGIKAAFICGSTGEGLSLSTDERLQVAERWKAVIGDTFLLLVHVGHHCLKEAQALAKHAQTRVKARAIAAMSPSYFKPRAIEDLVCFCAEVASAAPQTPFYYYHQPEYSGVYFPMADFLKIAADKIPNLAGLKYTHSDMMDFGRCLDFDEGRFNILSGQDENLLAAFAMGARGAIGSTYNFAAPLYHHIIEAYEKGDITDARKQQARARDLVAVIIKFGGFTALKAIMRIIGIDCGPCRLPLRSFSDSEYEALYTQLKQVGFFTYCSNVGKR